jgi:hypothetical protein
VASRERARRPTRTFRYFAGALGVYRIADGKIAECWLLPFDQYLFDELWT